MQSAMGKVIPKQQRAFSDSPQSQGDATIFECDIISIAPSRDRPKARRSGPLMRGVDMGMRSTRRSQRFASCTFSSRTIKVAIEPNLHPLGQHARQPIHRSYTDLSRATRFETAYNIIPEFAMGRLLAQRNGDPILAGTGLNVKKLLPDGDVICFI